MGLHEILRENRDEIVARWFERTIDTYPSDARRFFRNLDDPISNPVGSTIFRGMSEAFDRVLEGGDLDTEGVRAALDDIMRVRAVQEFTAAMAVSFVFDLKVIVRHALGTQIGEKRIVEDFLTFEGRIDKLALLAFNIFMQCREKIYELRAWEFKNRTARILQRACQVWEARGEPLPEELKEL